ncbi:MAG TPA: hypothetical protein VFN05_16410 [Actinomycetes bacterium]|nr:hypothetical protein [Actinomycetes bacterium]
MLGDGVMFHFRVPGQTVVAALELAERTPQARITGHAGPGQGRMGTAEGG